MRWGVLGIFAAVAGLSTAAIAASFDPRANQAIERSRKTNATYSLYMWNRITKADENPTEEWSAEFHNGTLHRVETLHLRVVADCAAVMGSWLNVDTGETATNAQAARVACGISSAAPLRSDEFVSRGKSRFGPVDRIRVTDDEVIRTYDVADNGALVAATISDLNGTLRLENWAVDLRPTLPSEDIFSKESLQRSVVPDQYKQRPTRR
jgi:hypothetical protein